jgi:hypothetical protein
MRFERRSEPWSALQFVNHGKKFTTGTEEQVPSFPNTVNSMSKQLVTTSFFVLTFEISRQGSQNNSAVNNYATQKHQRKYL